MTEFVRTEATGFIDSRDHQICDGDILKDENRQLYECVKEGDSWAFVNTMTKQKYEGAAAELTIVIFNCEEA